MGGGTTTRPELAKQKIDLLVAVPPRDQIAGMTPRAADFCERPPEVPFVVILGADVRVDMHVRLVSAADPMLVLNDEEEPIGIVDDAYAVALRGCVLLGYEFEGEVLALDEDGLVGVLELRGQIA